jgi:hypothetical protein
MATIDSKIPKGPLAQKWTNYKNHQKLDIFQYKSVSIFPVFHQ